VSIDVGPGEVVAVTGPSGAGKSTLLHCLGGLLRPTGGEVLLEGREIQHLPERALSRIRRENFGFVLQFGELVVELTVRENVELPLRLVGVERREARRRAEEMLARLDITELAGRRVYEVSGGQAQRVAVGRALVHRPRVVFADEPTGALDAANAGLVLNELLTLAREQSTAVLLVTHDREVALTADRCIEMRDGALAVRVPRPA
jgi:putative ABC transport system ATP-binding protein